MRLHRVYRNIGDPLHWAGSTRKRWRVRMYLRMLDAVVALSEANAVTLTEHFGVPIQKIAVIPRGVPADRCPPISQKGRVEARRRLGLPEARIALSIGALSPEKDVGAAIRSIASIAGAYMLVVGDGPERAALERLANDAAPGRIRFTGSLADPADAFAAADLVVLPSLSEGIPGVLIEAGLYGLPAVATDVGNVREVVVDGGTGILVPSGDRSALTRALADVFEDPARLGTRARQHCLEHFELGVVAKAWDGVLTQLGAW
jgi:glycosyltransferase involved in cell wall biosynthesis